MEVAIISAVEGTQAVVGGGVVVVEEAERFLSVIECVV